MATRRAELHLSLLVLGAWSWGNNLTTNETFWMPIFGQWFVLYLCYVMPKACAYIMSISRIKGRYQESSLA